MGECDFAGFDRDPFPPPGFLKPLLVFFGDGRIVVTG